MDRLNLSMGGGFRGENMMISGPPIPPGETGGGSEEEEEQGAD